MVALYEAKKASLEEAVLAELSPEVPWTLIERFTTLVRESGSEDEREAARYIAAQLEALGIPHKVYEPDLFLSVPVKSSLTVNGKVIRAKSPAFSITTGPQGLTGEVVYIPSASSAALDLLDVSPTVDVDVAGKIVMIEGFGGPPPVRAFEQKGAIGQIYINPGVDIHWGICTTIWGAPDLDNYQRQPRTPVVSISRPDSEALIEQLKQGPLTVTLNTELKEGWFPCPVVVADIQGQEEPERFVLAHGHYDSWDVGIGDNAVGDATLLELARVFYTHRNQLARSLKVAWWPGHSTGRYAGSTWFADTFGLDLARNCVAQVDIDSPGCRWATEYYEVSWMTETEDFCKQAIMEVTGKVAEGERPHQAGDYSFNNIGLSGFFMLLSEMPREMRNEKGYYPVGGCGMNIAWHTENDQLEIADKDNLMRDLRVYVATLQRVLNNPLHPFDFRKLAAEFNDTLTGYASAAGDEVNFQPAFDALADLTAALDSLHAYEGKLSSKPVTDPAVRAYNDAILELGRELVLINFTRQGRFRTEPAVKVLPLPDLAPAKQLASASGHMRHIIQTHLVRGVNRVAWAFESAARSVQRAVDTIEG
ncbi:MAG: M28 family peptidase [Anaerolineae bacterium]|nr:M28 family peptidase [Anaerolineae bacterium]